MTAPTPEFSARRMGPLRRFFAQRPRAVDLLVIGIYLLLGGVSASLDLDLRPWQAALVLLGFCGSAAALWWRRQAPLKVLVILLAVSVLCAAIAKVPVGNELGVTFALYAVASWEGFRRTWLAFLASTAAVVATYLLAGFGTAQASESLKILDENGEVVIGNVAILLMVVVVLVIHLITVLIGLNMRSRRQHFQAITDRANQLALERDQRAQLAVAAERARIARELHDVVAHSVSVMITLSEGAAVMTQRDPQRAREALEKAAATGRSALEDMRTILGVLREDGAAAELAPQMVETIPELIQQFAAAGLPVQLHLEERSLPQDPRMGVQLYRIVQEALTNVLRHSPASEAITVDIRRAAGTDGNMVEATIENDLTRLVAQNPAGRGIIGMRERVGALGGQITAGPVGDRWRVQLRIPDGDAAELSAKLEATD